MATKTAIKSNKKSTKNTKSTVSTATAKVSNQAISYNTVCQTLNKPMVGVMVAEFVGAFLLTASFLEMQGNPLFFAFALAGIVFIVGGASGAHLNPAVTFGAWVTRKMDWMKALAYIVAQLLGAGLAFLVLNTFLHANESAASATTSLYHAATITAGKEWYIFFAELLGTAVLVLGAATALRAKRGKTVASFAYGFAALIAFYVAMSLTTVLLTESGVSLTFLNPAVAMSANGLSWDIWQLAIYILAPALGGVIGFFIADVLHCKSSEKCNCEICK